MLLIPLRHEGLNLRRLPLVSFAIIATCLAVFVQTVRVEAQLEPEFDQLAREAAVLVRTEPSARPSELLMRLILSDGQARHFLNAPPEDYRSREGSAEEQMASIEEDLKRLIAHDVRSRLAYGGKDVSVARAFGSLFSHGSWLHLIFNMWFLWVCGVALEDRLGRFAFLGLYLTGGLFAGWAHTVMSVSPAIGASGAVAACMGLFAVFNGREKVSMGWGGILPVPIEILGKRGFGFRLYPLPISLGFILFSAPAFLLACLWVGGEVYAELTELEGSGVARWAHIGGFAYGIALALVLKVSGAESKLKAATKKLSYKSSDLHELRARSQDLDKNPADAEQLVLDLEELRKRPGSDFISAEELLLDVARALSPRRSAEVHSRLLAERLRQKMEALSIYESARSKSQHLDLPARLRLALARSLVQDQPGAAWEVTQELVQSLPEGVFLLEASLLRARLAIGRARLDVARASLQTARGQLGWAPNLEAEVAALEGQAGLIEL